VKFKEYALIPARGGSRGIPRKNLAKVGPMTLLERAILTAIESNVFHRIVLSSDDDEILNVAKKYPIDLHQRNSWASTDLSTASDVICDVIPFFEELELESIRITYLQPTSPFRTSENIVEAMTCADMHSSRSCVSVTKVKNSPYKMVTLTSDTVTLFFPEKPELLTANRQQLPDVYLPNGAIYIFPVSSFLRYNQIPIQGATYLEMSERESVDVDSTLDLEIARILDSSIG
jgi:CMP-N,N'-diacetyllegionaminic acid synthase